MGGGADPLAALEPGVLVGKTRLQHLTLQSCGIVGQSAGVEQLLSHLQQLQQLTYLQLALTLVDLAPAAAYAALTASSKLQHLDLSWCTLPAGVWRCMFPAGRQLQHLRVLDVSDVKHSSSPAEAPDCNLLASCCPGLHSLNLKDLQYSAGLLTPLARLSSLQMLNLIPACESGEGLEVVGQLTWLRELWLRDPSMERGILMSLTQLRQLTYLDFYGYGETIVLLSQVSNMGHVSYASHRYTHPPPLNFRVEPQHAGYAPITCWGVSIQS
jgi:hypothetical protein